MSTTPAVTASAPAQPTRQPKPASALGRDEFMKLLVSQLRNQDPMDPMKSEQFAAQLAQFSSLEQLTQINEQLAAGRAFDQALAQAVGGSSAVALLGRSVLADGNDVVVPEPGGGELTADIGGAGGRATLRVYDAGGLEVGSRQIDHLPAGRQTIALGSAADGLAPGRYTYALEVVDGAGRPVTTRTFTRGVVDAVRYGELGPILVAGSLEISWASVVEVLAAR